MKKIRTFKICDIERFLIIYVAINHLLLVKNNNLKFKIFLTNDACYSFCYGLKVKVTIILHDIFKTIKFKSLFISFLDMMSN